MFRKMIIGILAALSLTLGLMGGPATAGAVAITDGLRVDVSFKGKKPTKATLIVAGKRYPLKRKGKVWRTKPLSAETVASMAGVKAKIKAKIGGKNKTLRITVQGGSTTPPPGTPGTPGTPGGGSQPLFAAPGVDRVGNEAWEAVKGYFANSTVTDCPAGWPNCAVEIRYGYFENGTHWYCRLTSNSGSDIRSVGTIQSIVGAEQKADGAWGVSFALDSYGNTTYYSVRVGADGSANVQYWGPGADPAGPATSVDTGLAWVRGAKDCSY